MTETKTTGSSSSVFTSSAAKDPTVRKLYGTCVDCVKILDKGTKGDKPADVKSISVLTPVRKRLRECCEKLMFINPLEFGRRADEMMWRKCYYEPIRSLRQNIQTLDDEGKCFLNTLLTSAIGYYLMLSLKIQREYPQRSSKLAIGGNDFQLSILSPMRKNQGEEKSGGNQDDKKLAEWSINARHRLLIYQGDLARYLHELDDPAALRTAQHYYHQALRLKPSNGTPFNQLGTLFLSQNYGLDAVYYYLRCVCSEESFAGAEDNLSSSLAKATAQLESSTMSSGLENGGLSVNEISPEEDSKRFILLFLDVVRILYMDEAKSNEDGSVQRSCGLAIRAFSIAVNRLITLDGDFDEDAKPGIDFDSVLKVFVIQIMLIWRLQGKGSMKLSPAVALFLSTFATFLSRVIQDFSQDLAEHRRGFLDNLSSDVEPKILSDDKPSTGSGGKSIRHHHQPTVNSSSKQLDTSAKKKPPPPLLLTRRRQKGENGEDSGEDDEDDEEEELEGALTSSTNTSSSEDVIEISDDEEALGIGKLLRNGQNHNHEQQKQQQSSTAAVTNSVLQQQQRQGHQEKLKPMIDLDPREKVEIFSTYTPLVPLKVACDWFRCNPNLLLSVQQNSRELWAQMARFLNFLPDDRQLSILVDGDSHLSKEWIDGPILFLSDNWTGKYPLPEDVMLRGVNALKQVHAALDYDNRDVRRSLNCEAIVRICCLREFGHYLIRLNTPCFQFDRARLEFMGGNNGRTIYQEQQVTDCDKKTALMRSMAQLRLKGELEVAAQSAWIPVYLVPDAQALSQKLGLVKKLARAQRFVIVIPRTTIDQLDRTKKESSTARCATRWLEAQFRRGNKFVRMQKAAAAVVENNNNNKNGGEPQRQRENEEEEEAEEESDENAGSNSNFAGILKCAAQLRRLVKAGTTCSSTIVTIATGYDAKTGGKEFEKAEKLLNAANLTGVVLTPITNFCDLWDSHFKKGGSSRAGEG